MQKPLVTVVMPVYNAEDYVEEAIRSILLQTYSNLELIIVDDNSEDGSLNRIYGFCDERIKIIHNETNKGIAYTTNIAIKNGDGKYIALMDDDDVSEPERIEKQVKYLENHIEIDVLGGAYEVIDEEGNHISYPAVPRSNSKYIKAMLPFRCVDFVNSTTMIRRDFIIKNDIWYRDGFYGMQDYQFFIEAAEKGAISSLDSKILKKRKHRNCYTDLQIMNNSKKRGEKFKEIRIKALRERGFKLDEDQIDVLNTSLPEIMTQELDRNCLEKLYYVLKDILIQAHILNLDYQEELEVFLKKLFAERVYRTNLFEEKDNPTQ